jgi:uncharacterized protein YjbI with pentapeptide repeats
VSGRQIRDALDSWVAGTDRSSAAVERLLRLLSADGVAVPWLDELQYGLKHEEPDTVADLMRLVLEEMRPEARTKRVTWRLQRPPGFRQLRKRWSSPDGETRTAAVVAALKDGRGVEGLGFGEHEGRTDLRGLVLEGRTRAPDYGRHASAELRSIDFSGSDLGELWLNEYHVVDCLFEGVRFNDEGFGFWDGLMEDCSFRGSDLTGSSFGDDKTRGLLVRRVDFSYARLRRTWLYGRLEDCEFAHADLSHAMFHADLVRGHFAGDVIEAEFYGPTFNPTGSLVDVDFSQAVFSWVSIDRLELDRVTFPKAPGHLVVDSWPAVLKRIAEIYAQRGNKPPWWVEHYPTRLGPNQQTGLVVLADIAWRTSPAENEEQLRILQEARYYVARRGS